MDAKKFYWMRYASDRATVVNVGGSKLKISKGDLFGVKEVRGKAEDAYLLTDGTKFRLAIKKSDVLMNRSKEYKGRIPTIERTSKVKATKAAKPMVKTKTSPKIILSKKIKPKQTKLTAHTGTNGVVRVKLSEIELPDEDDFTDHALPHEFRKFARVESSYLEALSSCLSVSTVDMIPGSAQELHAIIQHHLEPRIRGVQKVLDAAIHETAAKLKAWAIAHLHMAQKLGKRTDLFQKIVNDPVAATKQLADSMLGVKAPQSDPKVDGVLESIKL